MAEMLMGAFEDRTKANKALVALEEQGYTPEEISVISTSNEHEDKGYGTDRDADESVSSGAVKGGMIGGLAGLLAGAGVPVLAGLVIGGPIVGALGLAAVAVTSAAGAITGAAAGGLIGALTSIGFSKETATTYDEVVQKGGVVIGLTGDDQNTAEARGILEQHGARDVNVIDMHEGSEATTATDDRRAAKDHRPSEDYLGTRQKPAFGERRDARDDRDAAEDV